MRCAVHDQAVRVRLNGAILERAQSEANRRGMSLSEFLRSTIRAGVGLN